MKKLFLFLTVLTLNLGNVWATDLEETSLVSSDFASATERAYVGNIACAITGEDCPAPFTELYMAQSSNCDVAVNSETGGGSRNVSGKLQAYLNNSSKKWSWVRASNLASTAPEVLHIKAVMIFDKSMGGAGNTMCIAVGNEFTNGMEAYPAANKVVAGFSFNGGNTYINKYAAYGTSISGSKEFTNNKEFTLDWYINNSASSISYTDPNGKSHSLAAGSFDIWVDKVLFCDAVDKTTNGVSGTTMQNLYIGCNGSSSKKHEFVLSSINIYSLSAGSVDPVDPTITFNNGAYTIGGSALNLSTLFTSNSSGAVTYSVTDANGTGAAVDGTSFTATAAGTATVQASQAAATGYNAKAVTATITVSAPVATHTVTAASNNESWGTAAAADSPIAEGATTTITATPESGYRFVSWAVSGTGATLSSTTTNPTTLTMGTANATVTATFEAIPTHTVTAATNNESYGTAAAAASPIAEGATTTITATPKSGYQFVSWAVSGTGATLSSTTDNPTTLTMGTADATVTATFEEKTCPTSGVIFSMAMKQVTDGTKKSLTASESVNLGDSYATVSGGTATFTNTGSAKGKIDKANPGLINFDGNAAYLILDLECPLKTGGVISIVNSTSVEMAFTTSATLEATYKTTTTDGIGTFIIPEALNDVDKLYCWRATTSSLKFSAITITSPYNITFASAKGTAPSATKAITLTLEQITGVQDWDHTGWTADKAVKVDGEEKAAGTTLAYNATVTVSSDVTFTAVWEDAIEPVDPTITFNNCEYIKEDAPLDLSTLFSSNSTGAVTFTVKDAGETGATITNGELTATAVGSAVVTATQAAVRGYNAKSVDATITVKVFDCPTSGTIFSLTMKSGLDNENIPHETDLRLTSAYATTVNGSAILRNNDASGNDKAQINNSEIYFNGGQAYVKVYMYCALEAGDKIAFTAASNTKELVLTNTNSTSSKVETTDRTYTIVADDLLEGRSIFYVWRKDGGTSIATMQVTRPGSGTALDNTSDDVKAIKRIENGMLIIEKNGKAYNVMGQEIK